MFWLWMLIDAALRPETDYPSRGGSEKAIWIVALIFIQVAAIAYFFFVYRAVPRAVMPAQPQEPQTA